MVRNLFLLCSIALLLNACVQPNSGSQLHLAFNGVPSPCQAVLKYGLEGFDECTGNLEQDRYTSHYEIWATLRNSAIVHLVSLTVQRHIFVDDLIRMEEEGVVRANGEPIKIGGKQFYYEMTDEEKEFELKQMQLVSTTDSITSFVSNPYKDEAQKILAENLYIGSHRQLTRPINGTYYGSVATPHPWGGAAISGAEIVVDTALDELDSIWVTIEKGAPDRENPKPDLVLMRGKCFEESRGYINSNLTSPFDSNMRATFAVFSNLDEEEYF